MCLKHHDRRVMWQWCDCGETCAIKTKPKQQVRKDRNVYLNTTQDLPEKTSINYVVDVSTAITTRPNCHSFTHCKYKCSTQLKYGIQFNVVHKLFTEIIFPYDAFSPWTFHWKYNNYLYFQWSHSLTIQFHILDFSEPLTDNCTNAFTCGRNFANPLKNFPKGDVLGLDMLFPIKYRIIWACFHLCRNFHRVKPYVYAYAHAQVLTTRARRLRPQ